MSVKYYLRTKTFQTKRKTLIKANPDYDLYIELHGWTARVCKRYAISFVISL